MYELDSTFAETSLRSRFVHGVTTVFHPNFTQVYTSLADSGVQVSTIISKKLSPNLKAHHYNDFKEPIDSDTVNLFLYSNPVHMIFFS
jgi:predicted transcriptional regulator